MPTRELLPYVEMRPRIEARRAIEHAEQIAVGTGHLTPNDQRSTLARWQAAVNAGPVGQRESAEVAEVAAAARSAGVGFRTVKVGKR